MTVIVTRPAHQAKVFCAQVSAAGAEAISFPSIEIEQLDVEIAPERLKQFDILIFTSPNAVSMEKLQHAAKAKILAVGRATRRALETAGYEGVLTPDGSSNSEAILQLSALQNVEAKAVLIVAGEGGRSLLQTTLQNRGAIVEKAEVYRRRVPKFEATSLAPVWANIDNAVITFTSGDAARNLVQMIDTLSDKLPTLLNLPVIAGSNRIAAICDDLGFVGHAVIARNPGDASMLAALKTICKN